MKTCRRCGIQKSFDAFYKADTRRDGSIRYQGSCKPCYMDRQRDPSVIRAVSTATATEATCGECGELKPRAAFHERTAGRQAGQLMFPCKQCKKAYSDSYRARNPDKVLSWEARRDVRARVLAKYGLTRETFRALLAAQEERCAMCSIEFAQTTRRMCVDHDHVTGDVRQILCHNCNVIIGLAGENPTVLRAGADYLEKHHGHRP